MSQLAQMALATQGYPTAALDCFRLSPGMEPKRRGPTPMQIGRADLIEAGFSNPLTLPVTLYEIDPNLPTLQGLQSFAITPEPTTFAFLGVCVVIGIFGRRPMDKLTSNNNRNPKSCENKYDDT